MADGEEQREEERKRRELEERERGKDRRDGGRLGEDWRIRDRDEDGAPERGGS